VRYDKLINISKLSSFLLLAFGLLFGSGGAVMTRD
jgi:hypothetical protein